MCYQMFLVPLVAPTNVRVSDASVNSTSVELLWDPVDEDVDNIRGFFRGYQVIEFTSARVIQVR
jgi:hypothetical protein